MAITVDFEGSVAVVTWDDGENRINADSLERLHDVLDEIEAVSGPVALVLRGVGKFFSNGLDLARFGHDAEEFAATLSQLQRTIGRLFVFPAYTVAALNGHCFAGGALLSCAFDYRVMREDRGYWCMNEAEIGLALTGELWSILAERLPRATAERATTTSHRFTGPEALAAGIVQATADEDGVMATALEVATRFATLDRVTLAAHKGLIHGEEARRLGWSPS